MINDFLDREKGRTGPWMQVASGGKFFPGDPRADEVRVSDIARGLSRTCRYGGQLRDPKMFYSVAEHSVLVALACEWSMPAGWSLAPLVALFHDGAEAYVGDVIQSVKSLLKPRISEIEDAVQAAVWEYLGLSAEARACHDLVKALDRRIAANEKPVVAPLNAQEWVADQFEPLPGVNVVCLPPEAAEHLFLATYRRLCRKAGTSPKP